MEVGERMESGGEDGNGDGLREGSMRQDTWNRDRVEISNGNKDREEVGDRMKTSEEKEMGWVSGVGKKRGRWQSSRQRRCGQGWD